MRGLPLRTQHAMEGRFTGQIHAFVGPPRFRLVVAPIESTWGRRNW
jgi:hypothetical protein